MKELLRLNSLLRHVIDVYLRAASADSGPPLGTILGNLGINTSKFCKEFNDFTKSLPTYFVVRVRIYIYENRTFSFIVLAPSTTYLISILKFQKTIEV
jgi:large subunit ribosomal protein L11